jgi:hypothetical protein
MSRQIVFDRSILYLVILICIFSSGCSRHFYKKVFVDEQREDRVGRVFVVGDFGYLRYGYEIADSLNLYSRCIVGRHSDTIITDSLYLVDFLLEQTDILEHNLDDIFASFTITEMTINDRNTGRQLVSVRDPEIMQTTYGSSKRKIFNFDKVVIPEAILSIEIIVLVDYAESNGERKQQTINFAKYREEGVDEPTLQILRAFD